MFHSRDKLFLLLNHLSFIMDEVLRMRFVHWFRYMSFSPPSFFLTHWKPVRKLTLVYMNENCLRWWTATTRNANTWTNSWILLWRWGRFIHLNSQHTFTIFVSAGSHGDPRPNMITSDGKYRYNKVSILQGQLSISIDTSHSYSQGMFGFFD